jgi:hypothetical protein
VVAALGEARSGAHNLDVLVDGSSEEERAVAYPDLVGPVTTGDEVLLNTTAVELGLGTGGLHFVIAVLRPDRVWPEEPLPGRVMKARYTPVQTAVASAEEAFGPELEESGLDGIPVVCAPLHSMIGPIAAGAKIAGKGARVAYVMTDGAALPGAFSRLVGELRESRLLDGSITVGQAFGGDLEAVTVWTGMLAARHALGADVIVVADGPGNLGTNSTWGVSALGAGNSLNAAAALGGRPIAALRISFADTRDRHHGVSHHSATILSKVCLVATHVPVPSLDDETQRDAVWSALRDMDPHGRHRLVEVGGRPALDELDRRGVEVRSMGRGPDEDPAFFLAAGAAGILAGEMAGSRPDT